VRPTGSGGYADNDVVPALSLDGAAMSGDLETSFEWAQLTKAWEAAQDEAVQARVEAAYEAGRVAEHKRNRYYIADLLSGLLYQYGEISEALGESMQSLARVAHGRRLRAERRQMILDCRALAERMGRPRGYVYTGGPIPLTVDGRWTDAVQPQRRDMAA
jgi:hypothetical protein